MIACGILLGIFMMFFSCNEKDTTEEIIPLAFPKIKSVTYYENNRVQLINSFEYDSLGRCAKMATTTVNNTDNTSFTRYNTYRYTPGKVLVNRIYDEFNHSGQDTIFLNEQGLRIKTANGNEVREYDANGFLLQRKEFKPVAVTEVYSFEVSNENTVKIIDTIELTTDTTVSSTVYYTFIPNSVNTIGSQNMGFYFEGKQNKNLVKDYHTDILYRDPALYRDSYSYEYDAKGRVTKRTSINSPTKAYETYIYYN